MVSTGNRRLKMLYTALSSRFYKIPLFKKLGSYIISNKLISACAYYQEKYNIKPEEVAAGCIGLIFTITLMGGITFLTTGFLIIPPITSISAMISAALFYYKIIGEYENEARKISKYVDHITQDFIFALKSSASIFNAIKYVAKADYPVISNKFKEIIYKINLGENPSQLLEEFMEKQPSKTLRCNLLSLIKNQELDHAYENLLGVEAQRHLREEYENFTMQLENKIMITAASSVFLPLIIGLGLIFWGFGESPLFLILIPLYLVLIVLLKKKLLKPRDEVFEN
ncbi:MAG: hypothetical protein OdinLCB4_003295 [Candidatus Odinarchaeum yellowstonii]|uniref:Type II secretion system protein GspF domain-containing protein n=1 Tax=Odinarchaeota yellowstonii (strain LCB_4) TaxID=1841599 RepID=A0AAF0IC20_ODILC|nr:MAG: hypothetical protein OdinLCB4_003295 [Candidatus Odinarchaeum yellowstonii]